VITMPELQRIDYCQSTPIEYEGGVEPSSVEVVESSCDRSSIETISEGGDDVEVFKDGGPIGFGIVIDIDGQPDTVAFDAAYEFKDRDGNTIAEGDISVSEQTTSGFWTWWTFWVELNPGTDLRGKDIGVEFTVVETTRGNVMAIDTFDLGSVARIPSDAGASLDGADIKGQRVL